MTDADDLPVLTEVVSLEASARPEHEALAAELERAVLARLGPELDRVIAPILADVEAPLQQGMSAPTMERFKAKRVVLESGARGQTSMHREARTPLSMLFVMTAVVLPQRGKAIFQTRSLPRQLLRGFRMIATPVLFF